MSRNNQAYGTLKELLTTNCHLRHDELTLIMEFIFGHLNRDDDDTTTNPNLGLNQQGIKVKNKNIFHLISNIIFFLEII